MPRLTIEIPAGLPDGGASGTGRGAARVDDRSTERLGGERSTFAEWVECWADP